MEKVSFLVVGFALGFSSNLLLPPKLLSYPSCICPNQAHHHHHQQQQLQQHLPIGISHTNYDFAVAPRVFRDRSIASAVRFAEVHKDRFRVPIRFDVEFLRQAGDSYLGKAHAILQLDKPGAAWLARQYAHASCEEQPNNPDAWAVVAKAEAEIGHAQSALKAMTLAVLLSNIENDSGNMTDSNNNNEASDNKKREAKKKKSKKGKYVVNDVEDLKARLKREFTTPEWKRALEEFHFWNKTVHQHTQQQHQQQQQQLKPSGFSLGFDHWWTASHELPSTLIPEKTKNIRMQSFRHLFTTPLLITSVSHVLNASANSRLADFAIAKFDEFLQSEDVNYKEANNEFFDWQMDLFKGRKGDPFSVPEALTLATGWKELSELNEFQTLRELITEALQLFIKLSRARTTEIPQENCGMSRNLPCMYSWFSVHGQGSSHGLHVHDDSMLSAVYYPKISDSSGSIAFVDPRGHAPLHELQDSLPQPPFTAFFEHSPKEGDLIVFPSWLSHEVLATHGQTKRVSIAFNLIGDWFAVENTQHVIDSNNS